MSIIHIDMSYENFKTPDNERTRLQGEFRSLVERKTQQALKQFIQQRAEKYFSDRVSEQDLGQEADRIFAMVLRGMSEEEIEREIKLASGEIVRKQF